MTRESAATALREAGQREEKTFAEAFDRVGELVRGADPTQLLGAVAFYFLTMPHNASRNDWLIEHHVELLQALCLFEPGEMTGEPLEMQTLHDLVPALRDLSQAFNFRRLKDLSAVEDDEARSRLMAIEMLRGQTQVVRNWGYPTQMRRIIEELFGSFDDDLQDLVGTDVRGITKLFFALVERAEERLSTFKARLRPIALATDGDRAIDRFIEAFGSTDKPALKAAILEAVDRQGVPSERVGLWLEGYARGQTPSLHTFSKAEMDGALGGDAARLLDKISLKFGDLADQNPEHFFMNNPIWRRPIIKLDNQTFFIPILALLISFLREIVEGLIESDDELVRRYEARRAEYLEAEVGRLMSESFPDSHILAGSKFVDGEGRNGENDLLVLVDQVAIVVEAKSGAVHPTARRGAELRLERTIKELVTEPSDQSDRFVSYLAAAPGPHDLESSKGGRNVFDTSEIRRFLRLTVTLDELSGVQSQTPWLKEAGFIPQEASLAPTMTLVDLLVITDVLPSGAEKLHYLARRVGFEENAEYLGDESDLLAFYLDNGFNIGETEFDGTVLTLIGLSTALDPYFLGASQKRPRTNLSKYWRDLITQVETRRVPGWSEIAMILLNVARRDQRDFERGFKRVQQNVRRAPSDPTTECQIQLLSGPPQRRDAIVGIAFGLVSREERDLQMVNAAGRAIDDAGSNRALVLGVQAIPGVKQYPYGVAGVFVG